MNIVSTRIIKYFRQLFQKKLKIHVNRNGKIHVLDPENFEEFAFQSGDKLNISPILFISTLHRTPDGHLHLKTKEKKVFRIPSVMTLLPYKDFLIPEHLCILTGAGTESLDALGKIHLENYQKYMGIWPEMTFLEIGCGIGRDAFQFLSFLNRKGKYIGIDVTNDSILWQKKNIGKKYPNFSFYHFDAKHELYNPLGSKTCCDFALPAQDCSIDRIALGSVFTHLFEEDVVHYMKEIKRVLKPDGLAYATFFLYTEADVAASRAKSNTPYNLRFEHDIGNGCFVNDAIYKTGGVSYTQEAIERMLTKSGVKLVKLIRGYWSGLFSESTDGQDVAILGRP